MRSLIHLINTRVHARAFASALALFIFVLPGTLVKEEIKPEIKVHLVSFESLPERAVEREPVPAKEPSLNPSKNTVESHEPFQAIITKASDRYGVDPDLIRAVIQVESAFDPDAVSTKGASGLMQLMPSTARELGVLDIFDPEHNILGGARYLKRLLSLFDGDMELALAAYHAGMGRVKRYDGVPPFETTREYIRKVMVLKSTYKREGVEARKSSI